MGQDSPVVIIDLDEGGLEEFGQWPWPRTRWAEVVEKLTAIGATAIAFDIVFSDGDTTSIDTMADDIPGINEETQEVLKALPNNDDIFAEAIKKSGIVITGHTPLAVTRADPGYTRSSVRGQLGGDPKPWLEDHSFILRNVESLDRAAAGRGVFSVAEDRLDGIVRRVSMVVASPNGIFPALSLESIRVHLGARNVIVETDDTDGLQRIILQKLRPVRENIEIAVDRNARVWAYYTPNSQYRTKGTSKNTRHLVPERCRIGVTFFCGREALVVGQMGFFDLANRYGGLDAKNDPLLKIDAVLGWEDFRADLEAVWRKPAAARKSRAGRKPWDAVVMFKAIILCALYNLSDDQVEYQIRDRLSFMRFLGLGLEDRVPDAKTVWLYREQLARAGAIEGLFAAFDGYLKDQGYLAMGGQIIDASIVAAPKQRNSREENARIKAGETPEGWADKPAKRSQKDTDARWTKKRGQSHYGYKNHINVDRRHKLVRHYEVTDASVHDSQVLDDILDGDNTALGVWADSAYRSAEIEAALKAKGLRSRIHRKGRRNKPLSDREKQGNKTRSSVRVRVEHVFGAQSNDMGGTLVRSIGKVRATARIGLKNLAYNMRRLVQLERLGAATA